MHRTAVPFPGGRPRRDFLRVAGATALSAPLILSGTEREAVDRNVVEAAEERIQRYRKGRALLKLRGPDGQPLASGTALTISQKRHRFLFGCNIFKLRGCRTPDDNAKYAGQFSALLNYATLPFYWWMYERTRGSTEDERTEQTLRWCRERGIVPKGHPLAWNFVDPPWMRDVPQQDVLRLQIERIGRCMSRFKGSIEVWDVVNEATHYDRPECFRNSPKLTEAIRQAGAGHYLRQAFRAARQADPAATLLINDYRTGPDYEIATQVAGRSLTGHFTHEKAGGAIAVRLA